MERARATLARAIGARPAAITLTAGATEANNLAFAAVEGHVVVDAAEHESVLACAGTHPRRTVNVGDDGRVDPEAVRRAITPGTELVSVELANGEIGTIQPVREISRVVAKERSRRIDAGEKTPIYLHTDASQALGSMAILVLSAGIRRPITIARVPDDCPRLAFIGVSLDCVVQGDVSDQRGLPHSCPPQMQNFMRKLLSLLITLRAGRTACRLPRVTSSRASRTVDFPAELAPTRMFIPSQGCQLKS